MRKLRNWCLVVTMVTSHAISAQILPPDPTFANGFEEGVIALSPSPTFVAQGASNATTLTTPLLATLSAPATSDTFVPISSAEPARLTVVGGGVTVLTGQSSAPVRVNGLGGGAAPVTLTATLGNSVRAGVRVEAALNELGGAEAEYCNLQFPTAFTVGAGQAVPTIYGRLYEAATTPAPGAPPGWIAAVGYGPAGSDPRLLAGWKFFAASYNLQVANDDEFQGTFNAPWSVGSYAFVTRFSDDAGVSWTYCDSDGAGSGPGLVYNNASIGSMTVATSLVINEVDYDQVGSPDATEFVEIFNAGPGTVNLSGVALVLVNGADNQEYSRVDLSSAGTLASGAYLVVRDPALTLPAGTASITFPACAGDANCIQNGAPDGVALIDTASSTLIDAFSYEGSITAANIIGFPAPVPLVEGTAATAADGNTIQGSLARLPNGTDTNNAISDWTFTGTPTPGAANVP